MKLTKTKLKQIIREELSRVPKEDKDYPDLKFKDTDGGTHTLSTESPYVTVYGNMSGYWHISLNGNDEIFYGNADPEDGAAGFPSGPDPVSTAMKIREMINDALHFEISEETEDSIRAWLKDILEKHKKGI